MTDQFHGVEEYIPKPNYPDLYMEALKEAPEKKAKAGRPAERVFPGLGQRSARRERRTMTEVCENCKQPIDPKKLEIQERRNRLVGYLKTHGPVLQEDISQVFGHLSYAVVRHDLNTLKRTGRIVKEFNEGLWYYGIVQEGENQ